MAKAITHAKIITPDEFALEALPVLQGLYRTLDFSASPLPPDLFRSSVPNRLILDTGDNFYIDADQYRAVREGAAAAGDTYMLYTILTAFNTPQPPTWRLPLVGYEEYYTAADHVPRALVGMAQTRALYSPTGMWVVHCPELFALVAGSPEYMSVFKRELRHWETDLYTFLERFREAYRERNIDASWIQPLLDHMYGDEAPRFLEGAA